LAQAATLGSGLKSTKCLLRSIIYIPLFGLLLMICLYNLFLVTLLWPGATRRSFRADNTKLSEVLTNAVDLSAHARDALLPGSFRRSRFRRRGRQANDSHTAHGPRRATVGSAAAARRLKLRGSNRAGQPLALSPIRRLTDNPVNRREALTRVVGGCTFLLRPRRARADGAAQYTVVPTGTIAEKEWRLGEVQKEFALTPNDPYVFNEKAQLESDIGMLRKNRQYASDLSLAVAEGRQVFFRGLRIAVPNMAAAVLFWTEGCGARIQYMRVVNGQNVTTLAFGSQTLRRDDGAKFALELVEDATASNNDPLEYVQLAIPVFRLSKVIESGGDIIEAYGWTDLVAPGGLRLRVRIDETRRDPFEFVALRTSDLRGAVKYYEETGMRKSSIDSAPKIVKSSTTIVRFADKDATIPEIEAGSVLVGYGDPALTTGLLLLPPKKRRASAVKRSHLALLFLGTKADLDQRGPDDVIRSSDSYEKFEAALDRSPG